MSVGAGTGPGDGDGTAAKLGVLYRSESLLVVDKPEGVKMDGEDGVTVENLLREEVMHLRGSVKGVCASRKFHARSNSLEERCNQARALPDWLIIEYQLSLALKPPKPEPRTRGTPNPKP